MRLLLTTHPGRPAPYDVVRIIVTPAGTMSDDANRVRDSGRFVLTVLPDDIRGAYLVDVTDDEAAALMGSSEQRFSRQWALEFEVRPGVKASRTTGFFARGKT